MVCFTMYDGSFAHSKKAQIIHSQISMLNMPMQPLGVSKSKMKQNKTEATPTN